MFGVSRDCNLAGRRRCASTDPEYRDPVTQAGTSGDGAWRFRLEHQLLAGLSYGSLQPLEHLRIVLRESFQTLLKTTSRRPDDDCSGNNQSLSPQAGVGVSPFRTPLSE